MANNWTGAPGLISVYNFEDGALTADAVGTNTLTASASPPTADAVNFRQGAASADFETSNEQYYARTDADLSAGFPLKNGTTNYSFTVTGWMKIESLSSSLYRYVWGKTATSYVIGTCFKLLSTAWFFVLEFTGGRVSLIDFDNPQTGRWYFFACVWSNTSRTQRLYLYDATSDSVVFNSVAIRDAGIYGNPVCPAETFYIGSAKGKPVATSRFDGLLDEVTVWNVALSLADIESIRDGTYSGVARPAQAINPDPADDETGVMITTDLSWEDGGDADTFDVYFGTTSGALTEVSSGQAGLSYTPPAALDMGQTYYWRIDSVNVAGTTTGVEWSFTTEAPAEPVDVPPIFIPFPAALPCRERLEWHTAILPGGDRSEQRLAHRAGVPVQSFVYQLLCRTEAQGVRLMNILHASLAEQQAIPVWPEAARRTAPLAAAATAIAVDTRYADFRADSRAVVYSSPELAEVVSVATVADDGLTLSAGLVNDYPDPQWIAPCRIGYLVAAVPRERFSGGASVVEVTYRVTDNIAITGYTAALTYDGYEVLTDPAVFTGTAFRQTHQADFVLIDAGVGSFKIVAPGTFNVTTQDHGWSHDTKALAWTFRQWLHSVVGRRQAFLVPTFRPDFVLSRACGAADMSLYVENRGFYRHLGGANALRTYLAFRPAGAQIVPRRIEAITALSASEERIDLDAAPGQAFAAGGTLCWLDRCRLASDTLELDWYRRGCHICETQLVRVSQ